jgi:hypothetical protein
VKYSLAKTYLCDFGTLYAMIVRNKREENSDFGSICAKSYAKRLVLCLPTRPYSNFSQRCCRYPYLGDINLRSTIQAATNKSEQLNHFLKWVFFGGEGVITENSRDEQRKVIKYNHLVANCFIFHNVCSLTNVISQLQDEGEEVHEAALACISPYLTEHINRFGDYVLDMNRQPLQPTYDFKFHARPNG